jgi:peptide-methionine (S)-S-oxide reductase
LSDLDFNAFPLTEQDLRSPEIETATFGAGCFWKTENAFLNITGVIETSVGYMGGNFANPSYLDVLSRITGHAEVAQIKYDSKLVDYEQLLAIFWQIHDPTSLNRQGADRGEQYRSVIFYHTLAQERIARKSKQQLQLFGKCDRDIVTEIKPASDYYLADDYHQKYLAKQQLRKNKIEQEN